MLITCRCQDVNLRKEYVTIVESVREYGGDVKIFSSLHISGERKLIFCCYKMFTLNLFGEYPFPLHPFPSQSSLRLPFLRLRYLPRSLFPELEQLTGVAAILRFPMPELEDEESDED